MLLLYTVVFTTPIRDAAIDNVAGCLNDCGAVCDAVVLTVEAAANIFGAAIGAFGTLCCCFCSGFGGFWRCCWCCYPGLLASYYIGAVCTFVAVGAVCTLCC